MGEGDSGSRFLVLPLPLFLDISKSNVSVGEDDKILKVYGIKQRADTIKRGKVEG